MLNRKVDEEHYPQVQGCMLLCQREFWDVVSYCPPYRTVIIPTARDDKYQALLSDALSQFVEQMLAARESLVREYGDFRESRRKADDLGVDQSDADHITQRMR